jgi:MoaA/NifB/PqqE/SkfB family radical SAM enzyme
MRFCRHNMNTGFLATAKLIADQVKELELRRQRIAFEGLATLEQENPDLARLALQTFEDRRNTADWLTDPIPALGNVTPWQCISEGNADRVKNVLNAIEYGHYL